MKIVLVYFVQKNTPEKRKKHDVNKFNLWGWMKHYEKSGTSFEPCIFTDEFTNVPKWWKYEVVLVKDNEPPERTDALHKVGWMRSQAYELVGKSLVMDLDAIILKNLDELLDVECEIAMASDDTDKIWNLNWPEVGIKHNAGVMIHNSDRILPRFRELWDEKKKDFLKVTYFEECIFSAIFHEFKGLALDQKYNKVWKGSYASEKIIHFCGMERKNELMKFLNESLIG